MTGDRTQSAGMGIVVDDRHVLTCAHVVNSALGRSFESGARPDEDEKVPIAFPFSDSSAVLMGGVCSWHPMGQGRVSDIAVLELDGDVPEGTGVASLVANAGFDDHQFKAFGFRLGSTKGNHVRGEFMGPLPDGTIQIDGIDDIGIFIESGFSGSAVWDTTFQAVVGMVSSRNINPDERVAYLIPVSILKQAWPLLRTFEGKLRRPALEQSDRNRSAMLEKVRTNWISGFLQRSLFQETPILLGLSERTDAVVRPMDPLVQRPDHGERPLPPGIRVVDVYDKMDQALLILGAPGSGKTTLLLELARDLLDRADRDPAHPIPVMFPLSTWAKSLRPLAGWLVDELNLQYHVDRKIGQAWVDANQILPLLDGLDEVEAEHRAACVEAINAFRQDRGFLPLVICSRTADYQDLTPKLKLQDAIVVQPLSPQQVDSHLTAIGPAGSAVREVIHQDPTLWDLLDTPLMLNIITVVYGDHPGSQLRLSGTLNERRNYLFGAYVDKVLQRGPVRGYTPRQTVHWLGWLACQVAKHGQTVFYLERLQFDWVPSGRQQAFRVYLILAGGLVQGLVYGLIFGLVDGLLGGLLGGLVGGLVSGLSVGLSGLVGGPVGRLGVGLSDWPVDELASGMNLLEKDIICAETVRWSWPKARSQLPNIAQEMNPLVWLVDGLVGGLVFGLVGGLVGGPVSGLVGGLVGGLAVGLAYRLICGLYGLVQGLLVGLVQGLVFGLVFNLFGGLFGGLVGGLAVGLSYGLFGGLVFGLFFGLDGGLVGGLAVGLVGGLAVGLFALLVSGLVFGLVFNLFGGLVFGLVWLAVGLAVGLFVGLQLRADELSHGLFFGLVGGLVFGLVGGLVSRLVGGLADGVFCWLFVGQAFRLVALLEIWLAAGLTVSEIETRAVPNQGIHRSARNALVYGLAVGLVYGLVFGLFGGLAVGLAVGLFGGLQVGGDASLKRGVTESLCKFAT